MWRLRIEMDVEATDTAFLSPRLHTCTAHLRARYSGKVQGAGVAYALDWTAADGGRS